MPRKAYGRRMVRAMLDLPIPPSVNVLWRHGRGNTYRTAKYDRWRHDAGWTLKAQRPPAVEGWCAVRVSAAIPDRHRDLDNLFKALLDLLVEHRVIANDADVAAIEAHWDKTVPTGCVLLEVENSAAPGGAQWSSAVRRPAPSRSHRRRPLAFRTLGNVSRRAAFNQR